MTKAQLTEDYMVEQSAMDWLRSVGYNYTHGSNLIPEKGERDSFRDVVLKKGLLKRLKKLTLG
jgi:type I restriction enzyme R subunit